MTLFMQLWSDLKQKYFSTLYTIFKNKQKAQSHMRLGIIGSGNLGTAFAKIFSEKNEIILYDIDASVVSEINSNHSNTRYLPGILLNDKIVAYTDISCMKDAEMILVCTPSRFMVDVCEVLKPHYTNQIVISTTKGLSEDGLVMTDIIEKTLSCEESKVLSLSGPCIAKELAVGKPTMLMLGGNRIITKKARKILELDYLYIKNTTDKRGIQLLGFYKNIIAILVGICEGIGLGNNFEASLMTRAYNEFYRLNATVNINRHTFVSPAGLGDLYVTAMSEHSRNRTFGQLIGSGMSIAQAKKKIGQTIEGYENLLLLHELKKKTFIDEELIKILMEITHDNKSPEQIKSMLLSYLYNYR
jgi:glycerol-3-phosphate dehydrogenase (NAD(P)+)